ncbi:MAG: hypothetical protein VKP62_12745 [Candidatus Sericytochromatia bacterium]|nr:hypothetical protein [Candidatus Sericytochromatia bacterium]
MTQGPAEALPVPVSKLPPGSRIVDQTLKEEVTTTFPGTRLPGPDDVAPSPDALAQRAVRGPGAIMASTLDFAVTSPDRLAQTFTLTASNRLVGTAFHLRPQEARLVRGQLTLHATTSEGYPSRVPLAGHAALTLPPGNAGGWVLANWDPPVSLEAGRPYAVVLAPEPGMRLRVVGGPEHSQPEGNGFLSAGAEGVWMPANVDFAFQTYLEGPAPAEPATVTLPTENPPD